VDTCDLQEANGQPDHDCDGSSCVFWRLVEQIGEAPRDGCAIKYYELLGDPGVASWLLSVKERVERENPSAFGHSHGADGADAGSSNSEDCAP
jgi:hypothetical protein